MTITRTLMTRWAHRAADAVAAAVGSAALLAFPVLIAWSATGHHPTDDCTPGERVAGVWCWASPWTGAQLWAGAALVWAAVAAYGYISMNRARRDPEPGAWL